MIRRRPEFRTLPTEKVGVLYLQNLKHEKIIDVLPISFALNKLGFKRDARLHGTGRLEAGDKKSLHISVKASGDSSEARTPDPLLKRQMLYLLS